MTETWLLHGTNAGLCYDDHHCPSCEAGGAAVDCADMFEHPICGTVACSTGDVAPDSEEAGDE
jgi:hypothetical protein